MLPDCTAKLQGILPAGQRVIKKYSIVPKLLTLLTRDGSDADSSCAPSSPAVSGAVARAALSCLARIASCVDVERRCALRDSLSEDDDLWERAAAALLAEIRNRPLRLRAAADSALLLWVSIEDDNSKKEKLVMRHKVNGK
jgi:hypothetical protein